GTTRPFFATRHRAFLRSPRVTSSPMRVSRALVVLVVSMIPLARASAQAPVSAATHAERGRHFYEQRRYDEAIHEFDEAYKLDSEPVYLYNIAQAHRLAGHSREAISSYELYLSRMPNPPNRAEIERRIAELTRGLPPA